MCYIYCTTGAERYGALVIGSGFGGLNAAMRLQDLGIPYVILEKSTELGGTWWFNQYPGAACDIPSHLYSFSFYANPWWSRNYSGHAEILAYLKSVAEHFGLRRHIRFNEKVNSAEWDQKRKLWTVKTEQGSTFEASFLIRATGFLHKKSVPNFKNMDKFQGKIFHSTEWPQDLSLKNKRVAIIGTGATSVQIVPAIAQDVKSLHVFQRTAPWVPPRFDHKISNALQHAFAAFPPLVFLFRWFLFIAHEMRFYFVFKASIFNINQGAKKLISYYIRKVVQDEKTAEKLTPKYDVGCKRVTPADDYLQAFNRPNVHLVTETIDRFTETGIQLKGSEFEMGPFDVVVLATGFSIQESINAYRTKGIGGLDMEDYFQGRPRAYQGVCVPNFPNMFILHGPNVGLGHNSVIYMLECQVNYAMDCIEKVVSFGLKSQDVKPEALEEYLQMIRQKEKNCVFTQNKCNSWYLSDFKGYNATLWPRGLFPYFLRLYKCNPNDFIWK